MFGSEISTEGKNHRCKVVVDYSSDYFEIGKYSLLVSRYLFLDLDILRIPLNWLIFLISLNWLILFIPLNCDKGS